MKLDDLITELIEERRDLVPAVEASKLVAHILETEPETLAEWVDAHVATFVADAIRGRLRSLRQRAWQQAVRAEFADAVASGDQERLSQFAITHVVNADNLQRRVADMTGSDHRFVAGQYEASGKHDLMMAAFHRAVAKRVGARRTADVLTEEQYEQMLRSIRKPNAA